LQEADGDLKIVALREDGAAQRAGLSAGDTLVAIDGLRADMKRYKSWIEFADDSRDYAFVYFRRDELLHASVRVDRAPLDTAVLTLSDEPPAAFAAWAGRRSDD
jgi:predicted metalloprotease with PDZ domain